MALSRDSTARRFAALALLLAAGPFVRAQESVADEYEIRAAMVFNLTRFIQWPGWKLTPAQHSFELCELGVDPVTASIENIFRGKTVFDRPVTVRRIGKHDDESTCHLMYVTTSARKQFESISQSLRRDAVLTVGAQDWLLSEGGTVNLPMADDRVRIQIQITNVQQGGWIVSSKLLHLATIEY